MKTAASTPVPEHRAAMLISVIGAIALTPGSAAAATLEPTELESREGYYQLTWEIAEPVRLVESASPDFVTADIVYSGSDTGYVASGRPDGTWYYRLESADGATVLSEVSTISVNHHSLTRAFVFFSLGAAVFIATLGLIVLARPGTDELA